MADAIVKIVLDRLTTIISEEIRQEVRLVTGVRKDVHKLTSNFRAIQAVLLDAEQKQVKERAVRGWLDKLKNASYDMDDVLDEWNTVILKSQIERADQKDVVLKKKVCCFFSSHIFPFKQAGLRRDIAVKIKDINEKLDSLAKERVMFSLDKNSSVQDSFEPTTSFDVFEIYGRDHEKSDLVSKLLSERKEEGKGIPVVSIVGMGGIGKTTLAQFAYNDSEIRSKFQKRIWVCVSYPFDKIRIAKEIIEGLGIQDPNLINFDALLNRISEDVKGKRFILVLDDVWTEDYKKWEPLYNSLNNGRSKSKILVTTRNQRVAHMMNSVHFFSVKELSFDHSWLLFKQYSGRSQQECAELDKIGRDIVEKCKGLPLAIKAVGSLLRFKKTREQWKKILDSEMWNLEELEDAFPQLEDVFRPLLLSYNDLPPTLKQCFLYCVIFPKDYNIKKEELVKLWMAQGYLGLEQNKDLEVIGEEYFDNLAMRSFFQEFVKDKDDNITRCKMHDIMHDFAQYLVNKDSFTMEINSYEVLGLNPFYEKARHLLLIVNDIEASFPLKRFGIQKLRSLLVRFEYGDFSLMQNELLQSNLFKQLTCLRSLKIGVMEEHGPIQNIPEEIGKLIHLRYIFLDHLKIKKLPYTLCDLSNLQTLSLNSCKYLKNLPHQLGKLVNLRHLIFDGTPLVYMPKGVEKLSNLRTLSKLVVGNGGRDGSDAGGSQVCGLDGLKNLNQLRGKLELEGLSNVFDVGEAKNARLMDKENILALNLSFGISSGASSKTEEAVLEALEAPAYLKDLAIHEYTGIAFPNWIESLAHLKKIRLFGGFECEYLPALGKLPLLEKLEIWEMRRLKRVGNEFLRAENSSSAPLVAFPKLLHISFGSIPEWEEWEYENRKEIIIMPSLSQLTIIACPKLKALPDLLHSTSLKSLKLFGCELLENLPALGKLPLLESLAFTGTKRLKRVGNEFLEVENSSSSSSSIAFPQLKHLEFNGMEEWEEWYSENTKDIIIMPSLSELWIRDCPKLKALPNHLLQHSTSLQTLVIYGSSLLENWCQTMGIRF